MSDHNELRLKIWNQMTPAQRDYDRLIARQIPHGASPFLETKQAMELWEQMARDRPQKSEGCSCHINPPCDWCVEQECDE